MGYTGAIDSYEWPQTAAETMENGSHLTQQHNMGFTCIIWFKMESPGAPGDDKLWSQICISMCQTLEMFGPKDSTDTDLISSQ